MLECVRERCEPLDGWGWQSLCVCVCTWWCLCVRSWQPGAEETSRWGPWCLLFWAPAEQHTCYWTTTTGPPRHTHTHRAQETHMIISVDCLQLLRFCFFSIKDLNCRFSPQLCRTHRPGPEEFSLRYPQYTGWTGAAAASPTRDRKHTHGKTHTDILKKKKNPWIVIEAGRTLQRLAGALSQD